jgi:hypothetical protein
MHASSSERSRVASYIASLYSGSTPSASSASGFHLTASTLLMHSSKYPSPPPAPAAISSALLCRSDNSFACSVAP